MKSLKTKKAFAIILVLFFMVLYFRHIKNANEVFYQVDYPKEDISEILSKDSLTEEDYTLIFKQTGLSPYVSAKLIENGSKDLLLKMNELYMKIPEIKKDFVAFPVTASERNLNQVTPLADLKKGDILVTFNTHTLDWRHGHCGIVLDEEKGILLEHMSIGNLSCLTYAKNWGKYPGFVVMRYPEESVSEKAAEYAKEHLLGIDYNILAGVLKKDKSDEEVPESSHCSHIVWQAYKAAGVDIDPNGGIFVTPLNIAMSDKLQVVQLYGLNPEKYKDRLKK